MSRLARHLIRDLLRARRASRTGPPTGGTLPFKLTLVVTERCHHHCRLCRLWTGRPAPGPSLDELDRFFTTNPGFSWINLTGGELTARPDIEELTSRMLSAQRRLELLQFPTAGWFPSRTESLVRFLLGTDLPRLVVTVSIDGDRQTHDRLRGRPGAYERATETLARLTAIRDRRLRVMAGITLSSFNAASVRDAIDSLCSAPLRLARHRIHINIAHHSAHYYRNPILPPIAGDHLPRVRTGPAAWLRPTRIFENLYIRLARHYLATGRSPLACQATIASIFIGADLRVYPCSTWDAPLGHLAASDFDLHRLVTSPVARAIRSRITAATCPGCWTPCDAAPTMAVRLPEALRAALRPPRALPSGASGRSGADPVEAAGRTSRAASAGESPLTVRFPGGHPA